MDRALAAQHGAPYVHLVVFAIDVDRVREAVEDQADEHPFGWEVFLTEYDLLQRLDPNLDEQRELVEDMVVHVLETDGGERFGSQFPFAVWDAIARGAWPKSSESAFAGWRARPRELVRDLAKLWKDAPAEQVRTLGQMCLNAPMDPPLAPPTIEQLKRYVSSSASFA